MIVKNEEAIVAAALESVRGFDEIIVVDTGSTDRTREICARYTDKIYDFPWVDDFAAARNRAIELATGDWVYSIDADHELVSDVSLVKEAAEKAEGEGIKTVLVRSLSGKGDCHEHWREVLFRNDPEVRWVGSVHENLTPRATARCEVTRRCGYSGNHALDPDRNIRILKAQPESPRRSFYLGRECYERRKYDEAIGHMRDYLKAGKWTPEVGEAWLVIARCHWFTNHGDEGRDACLQAIRANPDFREALLLMSQMHFEPWRSKWANLAAAAQNRDVLFIRT
jgi:glycosyltransferase involved in cell wall biosynthesis